MAKSPTINIFYCRFSSFFQTLCLVGYCLLPCVFSSLLIKLVGHLFHVSSLQLALRMVATVGGLVWAIYGFLFLSSRLGK
jgi:hypothetical protein